MTDGELARAIREHAYLEGDFVLRSGRRSRYYLDKYRFETQPELLRALGERIAATVEPVLEDLRCLCVKAGQPQEARHAELGLDAVLLEEHPLVDARALTAAGGQEGCALPEVEEDRARLGDQLARVEFEHRHAPVRVAREVLVGARLTREEVDGHELEGLPELAQPSVPILVLVGLLFGAQVAGVWGALFGIPVIAVGWVFGSYLLFGTVPNAALSDEERLEDVDEHVMVSVAKEQVGDETHPHIHVTRSRRPDGSEQVDIQTDPVRDTNA